MLLLGCRSTSTVLPLRFVHRWQSCWILKNGQEKGLGAEACFLCFVDTIESKVRGDLLSLCFVSRWLSCLIQNLGLTKDLDTEACFLHFADANE